jgi:hypothetical protein
VARLKAALATAEAERDRARAELATTQALLDRIDVEGTQETIRRLQHELAVLKAHHGLMVNALEDPGLTHATRVVAALALDMANAHRLPFVVGEEPDQSDPAPIAVALQEKKAGIAAKSGSRDLGPACEAGRLSYDAKPQLTGDGAEWQTTVLIGPPAPAVTKRGGKLRREYDLRRKAQAKREREEREAQLKARVSELEAAAHGCPRCGEELLSTGYFCPACNEEHTVEEMAGVAKKPRTRGSWRIPPTPS